MHRYYIYICICICIHMHMYTYTHTHTLTETHTHGSSNTLTNLVSSSFLSDIQSSGESVGESCMSSSSIMYRSSLGEQSLSCPSSMENPACEEKTGLEIDLSGPGLRSRSREPPDLRPGRDLRFPGTPDLRPDLTGVLVNLAYLQVRSRSQVQVSGEDSCGIFDKLQDTRPHTSAAYHSQYKLVS